MVAQPLDAPRTLTVSNVTLKRQGLDDAVFFIMCSNVPASLFDQYFDSFIGSSRWSI